jgi:pimeloyl-ACP methyl ester carboxylesterase
MRRRFALVSIALATLAACSTDSGVRVTRDTSPGSTGADTSAPETTGADDTTPDSSPDTTAPSDPGTLGWGKCDDEKAEDPALECATLTVPLDYDAPDGDTIDIAIVRVPATGEREGAVLFNPGGPGGSGFDPIAISGTIISQELDLENFDLIGFDPRGVDRSNGIQCQTDAEFDKYLYIDGTPDTPEEQALSDESEDAFLNACQAKYGDTLQHYSTANTARDMDAIRAGLGDEQISYLGISYGTYLGGVYATLFPDRVRAFVLDSAYEPNNDTVEQQYDTQLRGFDGAFNNWAAWCQTNDECAFKSDDVPGRWDALRARLDSTPIAAADGRMGNNAVMERATSASLYSRSEWPVLGTALADAEAGDPAGIFALADDYNGRNPDGTFNSLFQSIGVIDCASDISADAPEDPAALIAYLQGISPRFAADYTVDDFANSATYCQDLTGGSEYTELSYQGDGKIVVIGGTNDPATPFRWAEELTATMGPNARLVTYTGEGHGQLLTSTCVTDIEVTLLVNDELPEVGTVCEADPPVEEPSWWKDIPEVDGVSPPESLPAIAAALGVTDTQYYSEIRTTELSPDEIMEQYTEGLEAAGFTALGENPIPIDGVSGTAFLADGADTLLVIVLTPEAFDTDDLSSAKPSAPPGKNVVMLVYLV